MADGAKSELQDNLGPEFSNFDIADLNPKQFVRKHLGAELTGDGMLLGRMADNGSVANGGLTNGAVSGRLTPMAALAPGETPPYDVEAT